MDKWPSSLLKVFVGIVLEPVIKILKSSLIKKITDLVPVVTINVLLFNQKRLFILTEGNYGLVFLIVFFPDFITMKSIFINLGLNFRQFYEINFLSIRGQCFCIWALYWLDASPFTWREIQFIDHLNIFETDGFDHFVFLEDDGRFPDEGKVGEDVFHDGFFEEDMLGSDVLLEWGKFQFGGILDF